jgi:dTDP-4-amino-4,6-dideoxygalactose transaminase
MQRVTVFGRQVDAHSIERLIESIHDGWLGLGARTREFEERIRTMLGASGRHVIATNSGTAALHIALLAAGVSRGDEVITPSFTYVSAAQAITACGAEVVFCDIREDNLGIDCDKAEHLITDRTKAILPLHFAGIPCDIAAVYRLARRHNLRVIEDACNAFGSSLNGEVIGSHGDLACFSFDPTKIITTVDGGAVVSGDKAEWELLKRLRFLGKDRPPDARLHGMDYDVTGPGFRYYMTNVMASIGIAQIDQLPELIASRRTVCRAYNDVFGKIAGLITPRTDFADVSPWIYSVRVSEARRSALSQHLNRLGIETNVYFLPVHRFSFYKAARRGPLSVTELVGDEVLTLPLHSRMKLESVERVIHGVISFFHF